MPPSPTTTQEYIARVDSKRRVTIRAGHRSYRVVHRKDGTIVLKPREEAAITAKTLEEMDEAMKNVQAGKRSKPADLDKYARYAK